ncbi:hypothetical protein BKA56DRAFT_611392 [Ilyonectria sp. MPI-CAGE-AT-0026]|nr:hypothetical protein BKA56DRAFT_611392 [Ilyonectria sp. MPI-CAGE-AT-0026]
MGASAIVTLAIGVIGAIGLFAICRPRSVLGSPPCPKLAPYQTPEKTSRTPRSKFTFRLRQCPSTANDQALRRLLSEFFPDIAPGDVCIRSLAKNVAPAGRDPGPNVATLTFKKLPLQIETEVQNRDKNEWAVCGTWKGKPCELILDMHFHGMTPLNDVGERRHKFDCIAISGLDSHPFGSWKSKRDEDTFMWLRDALPRLRPDMRTILYGYDTTLTESNSFKSIKDIAWSLIENLKCMKPKPLVVIAHSLGGIIFQEALVGLDKDEAAEQVLLNYVRGGVFFGVPSKGMETDALRAMVDGEPTEQLLDDLSIESTYLNKLDDDFKSIASGEKMKLFWAYETKTTPTVAVGQPEKYRRTDGYFERSGPHKVLVSRESATGGRYSPTGPRSASNFPIDENHSDMVKFHNGDSNLDVVFNKLTQICNA